MVDLFDHAEKAVKKKAAAAEKEQPAKEVRHGKWWYGPNYVKAKLKIKLSGKASVLADYIYSHYIEGKDWDFQNWHAIEETGLSIDTIQNAKTELIDKNVVKREVVKNNKGQFGSWRYPFNPDFETWKTITGKTIKGKSINGKPAKGKTIKGKTGNINIEEDKVLSKSDYRRDLNMEEREGAAAEPQPSPALSETAPKKTGSTGKEQEQPRPFMAADYSEEDPAQLPEKQEKPKKERKQFIPPTKEEIRLELESLLEKKGTFQQWSDNDLRAMTDKFFDWYDARDWKKNNGQKLKDWQKSLNTTWLHEKQYLPDRTTRNQPQRKGKKIWTADQIMELVGDADPQRALEQRREQEIQKGGVIIAE